MSQPPADVNYTFSDAELDALRPYGDVRRHDKGAVLSREGESEVDAHITLSGHTDIFVHTPNGPKRLGWMERGSG